VADSALCELRSPWAPPTAADTAARLLLSCAQGLGASGSGITKHVSLVKRQDHIGPHCNARTGAVQAY